MPILEFKEFIEANKRSGSLLGIDHGERVIGVSVGDPSWIIASPLTSIANKKFTSSAEAIFKIVKEREVVGIVIGLPLNMDGTENVKCQSIRQFGRNLTKIKDINIHFFDERFSTIMAEEVLLQTDMSYDRREELVDKVAAGYILQSFLDKVSKN